jgi:signal transduction histidine kinase
MIYWLQGNYSEALEKYLIGLNFRKEIGSKDAIAGSFNNIGELYRHLGNYPEALKNQMAALKLAEETGNKYEIGLYCKDIGKVYIGLSNISQAKEYLTKALSLSMEVNNKENIRDTYEALSKLDSAEGNYRQSLVHYKLYTEYKDSMFNEIKSQQIAQMREQYESEKKDKKIVLLNSEKAMQALDLQKEKQTKNYIIVGLALFVILSFFIYQNYRNRQKLNLQKLRNKIATDLHDDIGSTLSSISIFSQMAQEQSKDTVPMLETIGESSRKMLDAMADIVWTIKPENDQFEKIIMRMRSFAYELLGAKKIDFEFIADESVEKFKLPMEVRRNLYLIFKEATNNMVKYAGANKAMFAIKGGKNELTMMIRDNGKGFDVSKSTEGNGLKNMKKRAIEIGGQLIIDSNPGNGTLIEIRIAV